MLLGLPEIMTVAQMFHQAAAAGAVFHTRLVARHSEFNVGGNLDIWDAELRIGSTGPGVSWLPT